MKKLSLGLAVCLITSTSFAQWAVSTGSTVGNQKVIEVPISAGGTKSQALIYLPDDYSSTNKQYPLFIFLHGAGEGSGNNINIVTNTSLPRLIKEGLKPSGVDPSTGQTVKWIIVAPHAANTNYSYSFPHVQHILAYLKANYRIDPSCVWIGGLSAGGSGTWSCVMNNLNFSNQIAGIMPLANGGWDNNINNTTYRNVLTQSVSNGLAILSNVGTQDPGYNGARQYESLVKQYAQPNKVQFNFVHNGTHSSQVWDPPFHANSTMWGGTNAWTRMWVLRKNSGSTPPPPPPPNQPPVVNAGKDQTITLPANSVNLSGTASDPDGSIASYAWTKLSGGSATIHSPGSANTMVSGLVQGNYTFRLTVTDNQGASKTDDVNIIVNASAPSPNYPSIPARIEAESYYSMQGVQTENTNDAGGGKNVGWIDNGDWMDYRINATSSGSYTVSFRIASQNSGAQFQVKKSDGAVLTTVTIPQTGGYQNWQTVQATVNLPAGNQTLRLQSIKTTNWNINWMDFAKTGTPTPTPPPPSSTQKYEAENWSAMYGVQTAPTQDAGGGKYVGWINLNDWMDYSVNIPESGTQTIKFRVATPNSGITLQVRNSGGNVLKTVSIPATGGGNTFQTISTQVTLPAGQQTLRIVSTNPQSWNFNWFEIESAGSSTASKENNTQSAPEITVNQIGSTDKMLVTIDGSQTGLIQFQVRKADQGIVKNYNLKKSKAGRVQYYLSSKGIQKGDYELIWIREDGNLSIPISKK